MGRTQKRSTKNQPKKNINEKQKQKQKEKQKQYVVQKIINHKIQIVNDKQIKYYKVLWEGYPPQQATWEVSSELTKNQSLKKMINKYIKKVQINSKETKETKDYQPEIQSKGKQPEIQSKRKQSNIQSKRKQPEIQSKGKQTEITTKQKQTEIQKERDIQQNSQEKKAKQYLKKNKNQQNQQIDISIDQYIILEEPNKKYKKQIRQKSKSPIIIPDKKLNSVLNYQNKSLLIKTINNKLNQDINNQQNKQKITEELKLIQKKKKNPKDKKIMCLLDLDQNNKDQTAFEQNKEQLIEEINLKKIGDQKTKKIKKVGRPLGSNKNSIKQKSNQTNIQYSNKNILHTFLQKFKNNNQIKVKPITNQTETNYNYAENKNNPLQQNKILTTINNSNLNANKIIKRKKELYKLTNHQKSIGEDKKSNQQEKNKSSIIQKFKSKLTNLSNQIFLEPQIETQQNIKKAILNQQQTSHNSLQSKGQIVQEKANLNDSIEKQMFINSSLSQIIKLQANQQQNSFEQTPNFYFSNNNFISLKKNNFKGEKNIQHVQIINSSSFQNQSSNIQSKRQNLQIKGMMLSKDEYYYLIEIEGKTRVLSRNQILNLYPYQLICFYEKRISIQPAEINLMVL